MITKRTGKDAQVEMVSIEQLVPADHLLRKIDEYIASMEHNACMLIQVYSEESSKNLQKIIEKFDDSCIDIVSKYSCSLKVRKIDYYTEMFNAAVSKTIKGMIIINKLLIIIFRRTPKLLNQLKSIDTSFLTIIQTYILSVMI